MKARGRVHMPAHWRAEWTCPLPAESADPARFLARLSDEGRAWGRWRYVLRVLMRWRRLGRRGGTFYLAFGDLRQHARDMRAPLLAGQWSEAVSLSRQVEIIVLRMRLAMVQPVANGNPQLDAAQERFEFLDAVRIDMQRFFRREHRHLTLSEVMSRSAFLNLPFEVSERRALEWLTKGESPLFPPRERGRPRKSRK